MKMLSVLIKVALALMLGVCSFCAVPAAAQAAPPRLLFLGISKDGRASLPVENAVQLRLGGLTVSVVRAPDLPPCDQADCLAPALALAHADLALTGRIIRNEHACLATLWLSDGKPQERPIAQDIVCRADGNDSDLSASLADGAAEIVDGYLRSVEPARTPGANPHLLDLIPAPQATVEKRSRWSLKRRILAAGLGVLLAGGLAATASLASIPLSVTPCSASNCFNIMSFRPAVAAAGIVSGGAAASLLFVAIK